jgi:hypothetical protein
MLPALPNISQKLDLLRTYLFLRYVGVRACNSGV